MAVESGESVQAAIARALWECDEGAGWNMSAETKAEYEDRAAAVITSLGLERVPTLAISRTDEHIEGVPFSIHRKPGDPFCGDESICAEHEPVYRLRLVPSGGDAL